MKKKAKIIFKNNDFKELEKYFSLNLEIESGAIAFYSLSEQDDSSHLLVRNLIIPDDKDYYTRTNVEMSFTPEFIEKCYLICENYNTHILDIHTHPWSKNVSFSSVDDNEAINKIEYMKKHVRNIYISFLVFGISSEIVQGRYWNGYNDDLISIDSLIVI